MASFTKQLLSGSTNGRPIKVTGTATGSAVTIHTADASAIDEVWIYAVNTGTSSIELTIEFGGTTDPDDHIVVSVQASTGLLQIVPGVPINNSVVVKAFAGTADVINVVGWVNRIS